MVVLFRHETHINPENEKMISDVYMLTYLIYIFKKKLYIYNYILKYKIKIAHYAQINLFSNSTNLRTMSLALYSHIADLNFELIE